MLTDNEAQELRENVEYGRKAQAVREVLKDFLTEQRAATIMGLEQKEFDKPEDLVPSVLYLRLLRVFELDIEKYISLGEIAERRLNSDGE